MKVRTFVFCYKSLMPRKFFEKPEPSQSDRVPPGQYLAKGFPVLSYGETPQISKDKWVLKVWGLVEARTFDWSDLMSLPQQDIYCRFSLRYPLVETRRYLDGN